MLSQPDSGQLSFVVSYHGTSLALDSGSRLVHLSSPAAEGRVALYRPPGRPELGFLVAAHDRMIDIGRGNAPMRFVTMLLSAHAESGHVNLLEPTTGLYMTSLRHPDETVPSTLTSAQWEAFSLRAVPPMEQDAFLPATELLAGFTEACGDAPTLLRFLSSVQNGTMQQALPALISAALTILTEENAALLCACLLGWENTPLITAPWPHPDAPLYDQPVSWLGRIDDAPWFADAVERLQDWANRRVETSREAVPSAYDMFGRGSGRETLPFTSPGHKFLATARRLVVPRRELAVLATARDEGLYLLEWIAHHRLLGADRIFLYTNDNTDGSDALLAALSDAGMVTWLDNSGEVVTNINMQHKAYGHALTALPDMLDYRWVLTLDLDEFLVPHPMWNGNLKALLRGKEMQQADAVAFQWLVYFIRRDLGWRDAPCGERYTHAGWNPLVKTAFRSNKFSYSEAHHPTLRPEAPRSFVTADGAVQHGAGATNASAWINGSSNNGVIAHFAIKSVEEFVWKYARGENDGKGVIRDKHFRYNDAGVIANYINFFNSGVGAPDARFEALLPTIRQEVARMKTLPGVADAYDAVVANYRRQIGPLVRGSVDYVGGDPALSAEQKAAWNDIVQQWAAQAD